MTDAKIIRPKPTIPQKSTGEVKPSWTTALAWEGSVTHKNCTTNAAAIRNITIFQMQERVLTNLVLGWFFLFIFSSLKRLKK
jgi:hypothetical protein